MNFERLPNELLSGVFGYLHAIDLFQAFHGLNERFNQLLIQFPTHHVDFHDVSRVHFIEFCQQHLPKILTRVHSLHLSDSDLTPGLPEDFLAHGFTLDQFVQLRSLTLESIGKAITLNQMMVQYTRLPHLQRLHVIYCDNDHDEDLFNRIQNLPSLKSYTARFFPLEEPFQCLMITDISPSIERLRLIGQGLLFDTLVQILQHTPKLEHLEVGTFALDETISNDIPPLHLISLHLNYLANSEKTLIALFHRMPDLRRVNLNIEHLYISGRELEKIIVMHLPQLESFQFTMEFSAQPGANRGEVADQILATFRSSFWLEKHQWFVQCEWSDDETNDEMRLSTISYPFVVYRVDSYRQSKSTLPEHRLPLSSAVRVRNLYFLDNHSTSAQPCTCSFSHVSFFATSIPCSDALLATVPKLDQLSSLDVKGLVGENAYAQLQTLFDRATCLRRLYFDDYDHFDMKILELKSSTIRQLIIHGDGLNGKCFTREQCATLASSSLGQQCEFLLVAIEALICVAELLERMPNLRSLTFACARFPYSMRVHYSDAVKFYGWLANHFPNISWHVEGPSRYVTVKGWIR